MIKNKNSTLKKSERPTQYAIVVSRFNIEITQRLLDGTLKRFRECNIRADQTRIIWVPGAVEIPLIAQQLILSPSKKYHAIICLGAVIRGETDHYQYVCQQVSEGCQRVALTHTVPVIFGVLTTENEEQAMARVTDENSHKGREVADAAIEMVALMKEI